MARRLLYYPAMATTRAPAPDLVTLARLHAALDGVVELEELFEQISPVPAAHRLSELAAELRAQLVTLLRPRRA